MSTTDLILHHEIGIERSFHVEAVALLETKDEDIEESTFNGKVSVCLSCRLAVFSHN
jgi:hypothetical protein